MKRAIFGAAALAGVLGSGCDSPREDVAEARQEVVEQRQDLQETSERVSGPVGPGGSYEDRLEALGEKIDDLRNAQQEFIEEQRELLRSRDAVGGAAGEGVMPQEQTLPSQRAPDPDLQNGQVLPEARQDSDIMPGMDTER